MNTAYKPVPGRTLFKIHRRPTKHNAIPYVHRTLDYHRDIVATQRLLGRHYLAMLKKGYLHCQIVTMVLDALNGFELSWYGCELGNQKREREFLRRILTDKHGDEV